MPTPKLVTVANTVLRRARRQGYVVLREIRAELAEAGQPPGLWRQVVNLIRPSLSYRHGRYYAALHESQLEREQNQLRLMREAILDLIGKYPAEKTAAERRIEGRAQFRGAVRVHTENATELSAIVQDLSPSGVRLIANRSLLGCKVQIFLPPPHEGSTPVVVQTRILWSTLIADGLYLNGGRFLGLLSPRAGVAPKPSECGADR